MSPTLQRESSVSRDFASAPHRWRRREMPELQGDGRPLTAVFGLAMVDARLPSLLQDSALEDCAGGSHGTPVFLFFIVREN